MSSGGSVVTVEVVEVVEVIKHPQADRLDLLTFKGMAWCCATQRGKFKPGDKAVYFPIDSVLPDALMGRIFSGEGKTSPPANGRIRTIRLRGLPSQGLATTLEEAGVPANTKVGSDVTALLGVTKYQPPTKGTPQIGTKLRPRRRRRILHDSFSRYSDLQHFQKHAWMLQKAHELTGVDIVGHVKLHGTSARYGWVQRKGWWDSIRAFFGKERRWLFLLGSRNIDFIAGKDTSIHQSLPSGVYTEIAEKYDLENRIPKGFVVYGEIIGYGVQPHYHYGHGEGQRSFYVYDVKEGDRWLSDWEIEAFCKSTGLRRVAVAYRGKFDLEAMKASALGPDPLFPVQKVREGTVFRLAQETVYHGTRVIFKLKSEEFLLGEGSEAEIPDVT